MSLFILRKPIDRLGFKCFEVRLFPGDFGRFFPFLVKVTDIGLRTNTNKDRDLIRFSPTLIV